MTKKGTPLSSIWRWLTSVPERTESGALKPIADPGSAARDDEVPFSYQTSRRTRVWREVQYGTVRYAGSQAEASEILRDTSAIAIVKGASGPKRVQFFCPCGCGEVLRINVSPTGPRPLWRFHLDRKWRLSLYPSVDRTTGCFAHFILRQNSALLISYED